MDSYRCSSSRPPCLISDCKSISHNWTVLDRSIGLFGHRVFRICPSQTLTSRAVHPICPRGLLLTSALVMRQGLLAGAYLRRFKRTSSPFCVLKKKSYVFHGSSVAILHSKSRRRTGINLCSSLKEIYSIVLVSMMIIQLGSGREVRTFLPRQVLVPAPK